MLKSKIDLKIPLFIIWPFGAFLASLRNITSKSSQFIYILFTTLFGLSFSFTMESADSYRVAWVFDKYNHGTIASTIQDYSNGSITDFYKPFAYALVESFSNNPKFIFAFFGFIFGVFSYKSLKLFFQVKGIEKSIYVSILGLVFFSLNSIVNINGARFWTAAIICLCAIINLFVHNKKIWIIPLLGTIIIHFSFLFIVPFIIFSYALRKNLFENKMMFNLLFLSYIFTFLISLLLDNSLFNFNFSSSILPQSISRKIELYNSLEVTESYEKRGETLFHKFTKTFNFLARFYIFILILSIRKNFKIETERNKSLRYLFAIVLFFLSIGFLLSIVPSGGRFLNIGTQLFMFFLLRYYLLNKSRFLKRYIIGFLPIYSFLIVFSVLFLGFTLTSSTIWFGNIFWIIYESINYTFVYL